MISIGVKHSGDNATQLIIGNLELWFSYRTVVAFRNHGVLRVSENLWGPVTGKHINWIDNNNKKNRMNRNDFEQELQLTLSGYGFGEM